MISKEVLVVTWFNFIDAPKLNMDCACKDLQRRLVELWFLKKLLWALAFEKTAVECGLWLLEKPIWLSSGSF